MLAMADVFWMMSCEHCSRMIERIYGRHQGATSQKWRVRLVSDSTNFSRVSFVILSYACPTPT
jgi:hypothetical protein